MAKLFRVCFRRAAGPPAYASYRSVYNNPLPDQPSVSLITDAVWLLLASKQWDPAVCHFWLGPYRSRVYSQTAETAETAGSGPAWRKLQFRPASFAA